MTKSNVFLYASLYFFVGLFLIPLFFLPNALIAYEVPKVKFFLVWSSILFIFSYVVLLYVLRFRIDFPKRFLVAFVFFLLLFGLSFFGTDLKRSFFGNFYRWDGLITFMSLLSFGFSVYVVNKVLDLQKLVFFSLFLSFIFTFFWSVFQYIFSGLQVYAGFGQPVFLVGYLFSVSPFLFYGSMKYFGRKWVTFLLLLSLSVVGIMTKTIFGFLTIPFYLIAILYLQNKLNIRLLVTLAFFITFLGVGIYFFEQNNLSGYVFEGRQRIFWKSILAFQSRPLIGWGYSNFDAAFFAVDWPIKVNDDVYMDKAHSHLLEYLVTTGVTGLLFYVFLLLCFFRDILKNVKNNKHLLLFVVFYFFHSQTNIVGISEEIIFWLVFGLVE